MNPHPNIPPKKQDPPSVGASLHETKKTAVRKVCVFGLTLLLCFLIGLLFPLRPTTSALESVS